MNRLLVGITTAATMTGILALTGAAEAATVSFSDSLPLTETDIIDEFLSIPQFDTNLGTLTSVTVSFDVSLFGDAGIENQNGNPVTVTYTLDGTLLLFEPTESLDNPVFSLTEFDETRTATLGAADGDIDFAGASGVMFEDVEATDSGVEVYTDATALNFFTGNSDVDFLLSAFANSTVTGGGNILTSLTTEAAANLTVTYEYEGVESVPEPSALLGLGAALGVGILTLRKHGNVLNK